MAEQGEKRIWIAEINTPDFCGSEIESAGDGEKRFDGRMRYAGGGHK